MSSAPSSQHAAFWDRNGTQAITGTSAEELFRAFEHRVARRADRLFAVLLAVQWLLAIAFALWVSPRAWSGASSTVHPHLVAALTLGTGLCAFPLLLIWRMPGEVLTRHVVAAAQLGFSSLLIHLSGGRIETHFHVFGSLAFLVLYRDWRIIPTATAVVAVDHLLRGLWFPESVYGVAYASVWRTVEHAAWVVFEDIVLIRACVMSRREMREICEHQHERQALMADLENRVRERTRDLESQIAERRRAEEDLRLSEERHRNLVNNAPIGIFQTTPSGEILVVNPHLVAMLGQTGEEETRRLNLATDVWADPGDRQRFWQRMTEDGHVRGFESRLKRRDGSIIHVVQNARLIRDAATGQVVCCEGTVEDISHRHEADRKLRELNDQLIRASREAGMAEVATGVLHNVGNVLNSVNIAASEVKERLTKSRLPHLRRSADLLKSHAGDLPRFFSDDPKARVLPSFLGQLSDHLEEENLVLRGEMDTLATNVEHIKQIVAMQQGYAKVFGMAEPLSAAGLMDDALKLAEAGLNRHHIEVARDYEPVPDIVADRHRVLQVLVNIVRNAKQATLAVERPDKRIRVSIRRLDGDRVGIEVADNGVGISAENLAKIFQHGFTTKKEGHGFGLHTSVLAAREMKGDLRVHSDGPGQGAVFTLELPVASPSVPAA